MALGRISDRGVPPFEHQEDVKSVAEYMDEIEKAIFYYVDELRQDFSESELQPIDEEMSEFLKPLQVAGFISKPFVKQFGDTLQEQYYSIHPILTLFLRDMLLESPDALSYATPVAFQRFYYRRSRQWPSTKVRSFDPLWDGHGNQMVFEGNNHLSWMNFNAIIQPTYLNAFQLRSWRALPQLSRGNPEKTIVVYYAADRGIQALIDAIRKTKPTIIGVLAKRIVALSKVFRNKQPMRGFEDLLLDTRSSIELICLTLIMHAAINASNLGVDYSKYTAVIQEIQETHMDGYLLSEEVKRTAEGLKLMLSQLERANDANIDQWWSHFASTYGLDPDVSKFRDVGRSRNQVLGYAGLAHRPELYFDALIGRAATAKTHTEIREVEALFHERLQDDAENIDVCKNKIMIYENLSALARRRGDSALALQHGNQLMCFLAQEPETAAWAPLRELYKRYYQILTDEADIQDTRIDLSAKMFHNSHI